MKKRWMVFWTGMLLLGAGIVSPQLDWLGHSIEVRDNLQKADVVVAVSTGLLEDCQSGPEFFLRESEGARLVREGFSRSGKLVISGTYTRKDRMPLSQCRVRLAKQLNLSSPDQLIIENQSATTYDNARHVKAIMTAHDWDSVVLVTARSHMRRAIGTFQKQGITVYPHQVPDIPPYGPSDWFTRARLFHLERFLYEYGALLKYKWYGYI